MAQGVKSVTVKLRAGVSEATLPDNRKMASGKEYAISLDDFRKLSRSVRQSVVEVVAMNTSPYILPRFDGTHYKMDLASATFHNTVARPPLYSGSSTLFEAGAVLQGFGGRAFKLVKIGDSVAATTTKNAAVWLNKTANEVSVDTDAAALATAEFAGIAIGAITAGRWGWIQIEGVVDAAAGGALVTAGETVMVSRNSEGVLTEAGEVQTITLTNWSGTEQFTITFDGQTTAPIVRGTNGSAAGVQTALEALSNISAGDVTVSGTTDAGPFVVSFSGAYRDVDVPLMTLGGFTGDAGGSVAETVKGSTAAIGTALTNVASNVADVELRSGLFANRHRKTPKLFLDKQD